MRGALRPLVALCVVSLIAAAMPGAATADTPSISSSIDGIVGSNSWWRGSTHGNNVVLHWTVTADPPLTNTSGCDPAITIPGPTTGVMKTCTATNDDGTSSSSRTIKIDADPPTGVSAAPARAPDANGWYNHSVGLTWSGNDPTSGIASCTSSSYSGPDSATVSAHGNCQDNAGNVTSAPFFLKYDATDPSVSVSPSRPANANGWYTSALTISWNGVDATSTIDSCTPSAPYSGPDDATASVTGTCVDKAANSGSMQSFNFKYDATAPHVTATPDGGPNGNGWYSSPVTVTWGGTDATSGIGSCSQPKAYSGPDGASASVSGSCADNAGNSASAPFGLKYDATDPQITNLAAARLADANGWYNHAVGLTWNDSDAMSGIDDCSSAPYSGPDSATASLGVTCTDKAGNSASGALSLKYDATDPTITNIQAARPSDSNGWYNHAIGLNWDQSDATSGIGSCSSVPYSGPDTATASLSVTCADKAGNSASGALSLKYDDTSPSISVSPDRSPDFNGWYTSPVALNWTESDAISGIDQQSCNLPGTYSGPDSATASVSGSCDDNAGNHASKPFGLQYDSTPPQVKPPTPGRAPDSNGWYSHPVTIAWSGTDATSGIAGCTSATYSGQDNPAGSVAGGTCHDQAGNAATGTAFHLKYDATPPHITGATLSRPPDFDGWYTHPVTITWNGTDALSGIASCTSNPYSGEASATSTATGNCRDKAGNVTSASIQLKYDDTPPTLSKVGVASRASSDLVRWTSTSPGDQIVVKRSARGHKDEQVVFEGTGSRFVDTKIQPSLEYRYAIRSTDQAGNVSKTVTVTGLPKVLTLRKMSYIPRAAPKPILRWSSMSGASYYHVQLFRGSKRLLAAWPSKRQLGLASRWKWAGHRYTLSPGRYRWYVWGGIGKRSFARYRSMGSARFIVPPR